MHGAMRFESCATACPYHPGNRPEVGEVLSAGLRRDHDDSIFDPTRNAQDLVETIAVLKLLREQAGTVA